MRISEGIGRLGVPFLGQDRGICIVFCMAEKSVKSDGQWSLACSEQTDVMIFSQPYQPKSHREHACMPDQSHRFIGILDGRFGQTISPQRVERHVQDPSGGKSAALRFSHDDKTRGTRCARSLSDNHR